jgi:CheY-like chemotaxis protein
MPEQTGGDNLMLASASAQPTQGKYILLIDDDDTILDVLVSLLRDEEGYTVIAAHSGKEALRLVPADPPALVFMDIMLHGQGAEEVLRDLRALPSWNQFALVVCTAIPDIDEVARQMGCDAYLAKPFDLDDLLQIVAQFGPSR